MTIPIPVPSDFTRPFWLGVRQGQLLVPECQTCKTRFFTPEVLCPACGAGNWVWAESAGLGKVYSMSIVYQAVIPDQGVPFVLAAVDLDDGWNILTHIVTPRPEDVTIGSKVQFDPTRVTDEFYLPTFALAR